MNYETSFTGFADRDEGGRHLAKALARYRGAPNVIVVGLPRGGIVTAAAVAEELDLPLDVVVVRKLGTRGDEEVAMGAIGPGGVRVLDAAVISEYHVLPDEVEEVIRRETNELQRREKLYRDGLPPSDFKDRTVIVVDDGLATGATMAAAIEVLRNAGVGRIVLAVPVAPRATLERFRFEADEVVYIETPEPFVAVSYWYFDFAPVEDREVTNILQHLHSRQAALA